MPNSARAGTPPQRASRSPAEPARIQRIRAAEMRTYVPVSHALSSASRPQPALRATTRSMRANQPGRTSIEVSLRRTLRRAGLRPTTPTARDVALMTARPDFVFRRRRVAIFVHGCFWHACPAHASWPAANRDWWRRKLTATVQRDARQVRALRRKGWSVFTVWEHEDTEIAARRIADRLRRASQ